MQPIGQPSRLEMSLRHFFGWVYVKSLDWVRAGGDDHALPRSRTLTKLFILSEEKIASRNLPCAYGPERTAEIAKGRFEYLSRLMVDISRLKGAGRAGILEQVRVSGEEHLAAASAEGRGVMVVSAHAGTWWHAAAVTGSLGYTNSSVLTQFLPNAIVRFLDGVAAELGSTLAFVRGGAYEVARAAFGKRNTFYLSFDFASRPDRSVWMAVNERAAIPVDTGPGVMAIRHRVPLVWVDTWHDENGRSCIRYYPAIHAGRGTAYPTPVAVMGYLVDRLSEQIERHPEQWWLLGHGDLKDPRDVEVQNRPAVASE